MKAGYVPKSSGENGMANAFRKKLTHLQYMADLEEQCDDSLKVDSENIENLSAKLMLKSFGSVCVERVSKT